MKHETRLATEYGTRCENNILKKICCRVYLAVSTNAENRGLMVQQGGVKVQLQ